MTSHILENIRDLYATAPAAGCILAEIDLKVPQIGHNNNLIGLLFRPKGEWIVTTATIGIGTLAIWPVEENALGVSSMDHIVDAHTGTTIPIIVDQRTIDLRLKIQGSRQPLSGHTDFLVSRPIVTHTLPRNPSVWIKIGIGICSA